MLCSQVGIEFRIVAVTMPNSSTSSLCCCSALWPLMLNSVHDGRVQVGVSFDANRWVLASKMLVGYDIVIS